jgi:hypothetical protein
LDYAVNFGMKRPEQIWTKHLTHDGRLAAPIVFR